MPIDESLRSRLSAHPWSLYRADHLAGRRAASERTGFFRSMLMDDIGKQRYAYELAFMPVGAEWSRASEVMFALLNDFNHTGYGRDPVAILCDFVDGLLEETASGNDLLLELHALPKELSRSRSRRLRNPGSDLGQTEPLPALGLIPTWSVARRRSVFSQVSPQPGEPPVIIDGSRLHRLRLRSPNSEHWMRAVSDLRQVDATKVIGAVDRLSWEGYSVSEAANTQNLAVAAATAPIGWDGRGMFAEMVTSPYSTFRRLRFVQFWVEAVLDSVAFLNQFTSDDSLYGSGAFTFSVSGLPAAEDLEDAMRAIRAGQLTVEQAHNRYLFPKYSKSRDTTNDGD